jgi:anion-transporting  ArsA/GET3 family ATPase
MIKLKKRHIFIGVCALLLIATVKMCEADDYAEQNRIEMEEIEQLEYMQHTSDSLLQEVLHDIDTRQHQYSDELDSLNNIILNDNLTVEEVKKLQKKIDDTERLLEEAKQTRDTIVMTTDPLELDSIVYNIIREDSLELNIIHRDSIVYNIIVVDSIVKRTVYKIDTLYYDSDEIKKIKLKKG